MGPISDAEMQSHIASGQAKPVGGPIAGPISDAEMQQHLSTGAAKPADQQEGFLGRAVEGAEDFGKNILQNYVVPVAKPIGTFIDKYSGAPVRAAVGAAQNNENPINAYVNQFGANPEDAPTGKEIAQRMGVGETRPSDVIPSLYSDSGKEWFKLKRGGLLDPTASGAAGLGLDVALDPTNLIPAGDIAKGAGELAAPMIRKVAKSAGSGLVGAADVVTGTKAASNLVNISKDVVSNLANPKIIKEYPELVKTAAEIGIKPNELMEASRFGKLSVPSRAERNLAEGPAGQALLDKFNNVTSKIENAVGETVSKHAGNRVLDPVEAGELLKSSYANAENKLFEANNITYKTAADLTPGMKLTPDATKELTTTLNGIEKRAKGMIARGTPEQEAIGKNLLSFTSKVRKSGDSYRYLSEQIGYVGKAMSDPSLDRTYAGELRDLYRSMSSSLISTVNDIHPTLGSQLIGNNARMTEFFKSRDALGKAIQTSKTNPESLFQGIAKDANKINELKKVMPPDDFNAFRGSYLDSTIKRNASGNILWDSSLNAIEKNRGRLNRMFAPNELEQVEKYLKLGSAQGIPVLSTSGTGGTNMFRDAASSIKTSLGDQQYLDYIKNKNSGLIRPPGIKEATITPTPMQGIKGLLSKKRGPFEKGAKALQSIAPSQYRQDPLE